MSAINTLDSVVADCGDGEFHPSPLASGPFLGLQGGVIAAMLFRTGQALVPAEFRPIAQRTEFFRAAPVAPCRATARIVKSGRRIMSIDCELTSISGEQTFARSQSAFATPSAISVEPPDITPWDGHASPETLRSRSSNSPHGGPWLMDVLEGRADPTGPVWFRWSRPLFTGDCDLTFASILSPADWTHGIARPGYPGLPPAKAWPNYDLSIHVERQPQGQWIGLRPEGRWRPDGFGIGYSDLIDQAGLFGRVAMGVVIVP